MSLAVSTKGDVRIMGEILSLIVVILLNALVIWIVSKLGLGLTVAGFVPAIVAAVVIGLISWVVLWLLGLLGIQMGGGWWGAIISLIVSAVVLMLAGSLLPGLGVEGFVGALVAAVAIAVVAWLVNLVVTPLFGTAATVLQLVHYM